MCKACKMDPSEVQKMQQRQGAVEPEDFYEEVNYQQRLKKKNKRVRNYPGCPGNDGKAHVYVWTTETVPTTLFEDYYGFPKYQRHVCAGCGKAKGYKLSDEYMKVKERKWAKLPECEKGRPMSRWRRQSGMVRFNYWSWEDDDTAYQAYRREYIDRHGFTDYVWGY